MADASHDPDHDGSTRGIRDRVLTWVERGRRVIEPGDGGTAATPGGDDGSDEDTRGTGAPAALPDEERAMMTDEERVLYHLGRSERMGQSDIVERTDWSKAKVSRVLSAMEEEGKICRTQVGREKIVTLPGSTFDAAAPSRPPSRTVTGREE